MDDESESFILEIISKIKGALKYDGDINVYILGSQALNAAATQDGDVVINAGAILQCDNVYEFIAIVAHEVGHIEGAHIATFSVNQKDFARAGLVTTLIGAAASAVSGSAAPLLAGVFGGQSMGTGMALSKLRQKESIADTKAAQAIKQLQWPVFKGFVSIHRKLAENSTGIYNVYLSTHPQSQDRIDKCLKFLSEEKGTKVSKEVSELMEKYQRQFETVRHKIRALIMPVEDVLRLYSHPKNSNEKYAKAIALYRGHRYEAAVPIVDELIRQKTEDTDQAYYEEIKAMCLINMKRCHEAAEICWNILKNNRNIKKVHRDLGVIYADAIVEGTLKNHIDNAIKILKKIRIIKREDPSVIEELGKLYAMKNMHDEASLCAAEASLLMNDEKTALIHAKRALRSSNKAVRRRAEDIISSTDKPKRTSIR
jgi:predicted Zn-dependent protease